MAQQFPSQLVSTGGDEINTQCYKDDAITQAALQAKNQTLEQALKYFTDSTHAALRKRGKTPVVWEEMVLDHNLALPKDTVVMVWISSQSVGKVVDASYRVIHAASDYFYLGTSSFLQS